MAIFTPVSSSSAPAAIGTYSQAVRHGNTVYLSGQIPLDPKTMELVADSVELQIQQVFTNLAAVCNAAGGELSDIIKLTVYLIDLQHFQLVNEVMAELFQQPFPARAAIGVAALPRGSLVEVDGIMVLGDPAV